MKWLGREWSICFPLIFILAVGFFLPLLPHGDLLPELFSVKSLEDSVLCICNWGSGWMKGNKQCERWRWGENSPNPFTQLCHHSSSRAHFFFFWLRWVFIAARGLSLVAASGGCSYLQWAGFWLLWLLLLWSTGSRHATSLVVAHGL